MDTIDKNVVPQSETIYMPSEPIKRKRGRPLGSRNIKNRTVTRRAIMAADGSLRLLGRGRAPANAEILMVATQIIRQKRHNRKMSAVKHVVAVEPKIRTAVDLNAQAVQRLVSAGREFFESLAKVVTAPQQHLATIRLDSKN